MLSDLVSSAYLRLLIFLPAILIPAGVSSSPVFLMMCFAQKLNKQGDRTPGVIGKFGSIIQSYPNLCDPMDNEIHVKCIVSSHRFQIDFCMLLCGSQRNKIMSL